MLLDKWQWPGSLERPRRQPCPLLSSCKSTSSSNQVWARSRQSRPELAQCPLRAGPAVVASECFSLGDPGGWACKVARVLARVLRGSGSAPAGAVLTPGAVP